MNGIEHTGLLRHTWELPSKLPSTGQGQITPRAIKAMAMAAKFRAVETARAGISHTGRLEIGLI